MNRKIALITGASRGLGKNTAQHLAAQGIEIIGTYHSKAQEAQALVRPLERSGIRAAMLQLDVSVSASNTALGRVGLPDDIGAAVALLLGEGGGWINGQRLEVSGGMFL